jgi:ATP-binding cassette subfamily F protein 3
MDEPTNHLDILSREILKKALKQYDGALVIVSHDRDFLQGLTDKVYEFRNKGIKEYHGDINDFLQQRQMVDFKELEMASMSKKKEIVSKVPSKNKLAYQERKQREKDLKKANNRLRKLEKEVDVLEKTLKELDEQLADPVRFKELSSEKGFFDDYEQKGKDLQKLMEEWEEAQTTLDMFNGKEG